MEASDGDARAAVPAELGRAAGPRKEMTAEGSTATVGLSRPGGRWSAEGGWKSPARPEAESEWQGRWQSRETWSKASCDAAGMQCASEREQRRRGPLGVCVRACV